MHVVQFVMQTLGSAHTNDNKLAIFVGVN
jgi:hypothetical protein